jgi:hypothetical protein
LPVAYFKCECGEEHRTIVEQDHTNFTYNENTRHWVYDPTKKDPQPPVRTHTCEKCGKIAEEAPDPKSVKSFLQFNWFED